MNTESQDSFVGFIEDHDRIEVMKPLREDNLALPIYLESVSAGFPSPADDYTEKSLDLNDLLIKNPAATFFVRVSGDSMINAGMSSGDILVVDRSLDAKNNSIVIAVVNGEMTVKKLSLKNGEVFLCPENPKYKPIKITSEMYFEVWGVVRSVIHSTL